MTTMETFEERLRKAVEERAERIIQPDLSAHMGSLPQTCKRCGDTYPLANTMGTTLDFGFCEIGIDLCIPCARVLWEKLDEQSPQAMAVVIMEDHQRTPWKGGWEIEMARNTLIEAVATFIAAAGGAG